MSIFFLFAYLFAPRELLRTVWKNTSIVMQLSIIMNLLCAIVLVQWLITVSYERASALVTLFIIVYAGFYGFAVVLAEPAQSLKNFLDGSQKKFDAADPQGRQIRRD